MTQIQNKNVYFKGLLKNILKTTIKPHTKWNGTLSVYITFLKFN
jgi:hypothetical protein